MDLLTPVDSTPGRFHDGHGIVGQQSQANTTQGRLGIAQRIDFTAQRFRHLLEQRFNRLPLAVTLRQLWGAGLPSRDVAQHVDFPIPIPGRLMQGDRNATQR